MSTSTTTSAYSTPPHRRPPLRLTTSGSSTGAGAGYSPVRSFSMPLSNSQSPSQSQPSSPSHSSSSSRRNSNSWDREREAYNEKEIFMGALLSPRSAGGMDEKRSIDVPCIILTEPSSQYNRLPSPPPKQILLLPPTSLALPLPLHSNPAQGMGITITRNGWATLSRAALILGVVGLGVWHVWSVLGEGGVGVEGL